MKTQKITRAFRFYLPVVMIAIWGGIPLTAQETSDFSSSVVLEKGQPAESAAAPTCLICAAEKIPPDSKIKLFLRDGNVDKGRLVSIDLGQPGLIMRGEYADGPDVLTYPMSEISKIQYDAGGGKLAKAVLGLIVGGGLGAIMGSAGEPDCGQEWGPCFEGLATASGAILGGILGAKLFSSMPSTRVIECK